MTTETITAENFLQKLGYDLKEALRRLRMAQDLLTIQGRRAEADKVQKMIEYLTRKYGE